MRGQAGGAHGLGGCGGDQGERGDAEYPGDKWSVVSGQHNTLVTGYLWSNWTHVGFSVMFLSMGEKIRRSSGIHLSANLGKLLYTRPASRPATKAPMIKSSHKMWPLVRQKTVPETSVRKTRALLEMTIFLS